ncbi:unnamed protein product [Adineta steineri]|uniref:Uncharacterized protein n=1 Tax=Adineta steineri TaxID=433720 RepID=A0A820A320_9BILA|nr:unnamed protein product [Adineta steineri]
MNNCSDQTSNSNHLSFHCSSGELLWGQLHCICEGYFNGRLNRYDTPQSIPELSAGGTIKQRYFNYRCRAAKGDWQAKSYQTRDTLEAEPFKSGYIIYNIHHNPVEILRRCATVGFSLYQTHSDRSIVYVNRYDWSHHHDYDFEHKIDKLLGIDRNKPDHDFFWDSSFHSRIMIIDSDSAMNIIKQWKFNTTELNQPQEKVFIDTRNESNNRVGLHLRTPKPDYELAWLVFSSDQPDSELIAIVYDGNYTSLDGQIILDEEDVVSWHEYELKEQELARRNADLLKQMQSAGRYRHN